VLGQQATQQEVYDTVEPVVLDVLRGYNCTVLAYGQTASGKTYTMEGPSLCDRHLRGVIPRCVDTLFGGLEREQAAAAAADAPPAQGGCSSAGQAGSGNGSGNGNGNGNCGFEFLLKVHRPTPTPTPTPSPTPAPSPSPPLLSP
jgi:hypothetical protein